MKNISFFNAQSICIAGPVQLAAVLLKLNCWTITSYDQQIDDNSNKANLSPQIVEHKIDHDDKWK